MSGTIAKGPATRPSAPAAPGRVWFPALDGLRAVAAILVVIFHVSGSVAPFSSHGGAGASVTAWTGGDILARFGNWGVAIFFLLSGFLLYRPFVANWFAGRPIGALTTYFARRLMRIVPAYWVALTFLLVFVRDTSPKGGWASYGLFYGFAQNYRHGFVDQGGGLSVAWTLCIEMSFYLVLPLLALGLRKVSPADWTLDRRVRGQVAALSIVSALSVWYRWWVIRAHTLQTFWLPAHFAWFGLGMLFAVWHAAGSLGRAIPAALRLLGRFPELSWLFGIQVFWLTTLIKASPLQTRTQQMCFFIGNGVSAVLLLGPLVFGDQSRGWLRKGLSRFPMAWLGSISYGIYLWHTIWLAVVIKWVKNGTVPGGFWPRFLLVMIFTIATAQVSLVLLERPLMNLVQRNPRRPAPVPAPSGEAV